jgi:hypothetical protein
LAPSAPGRSPRLDDHRPSREIEVLRELPSMLTVEEIAEEHQVSVNIVKDPSALAVRPRPWSSSWVSSASPHGSRAAIIAVVLLIGVSVLTNASAHGVAVVGPYREASRRSVCPKAST